MTYEEEAKIAQQVLDKIATDNSIRIPGLPAREARSARVHIGDGAYNVSRHGNDLRFYEDSQRGAPGRSLIVVISEHQGKWLMATSSRPPGEYHDNRAAEQARRLVEHKLVELGHEVGTSGRTGSKLSRAQIERDIASFLEPRGGKVIQAKNRTRRRP